MKEMSGRGPLELTSALGSFPYLTPEGRVSALERCNIDSSGNVEAHFSQLNFASLGPLIERLSRTSLFVEVNKGDPERATILMVVGTGETRKLAPAIGSKIEIVSRAIDDNLFPVLVQSEVEKAFARAGETDKVRIPLRAIRLRKHQPKELAGALRDVALSLLSAPEGRLDSVRDALRRMRGALRSEVLESLLAK